jgi:cysteine synthase A
MFSDILSIIGNTPLMRLSNVFSGYPFHLYAKLESFNPGGSIKDRAAYNIIQKAMDSGEISSGATIIESSSGNMGIGLAQVCAALGLHLICVVDPKTTRQNIAILKAYGAEIDYVSEPDPVTGEFLRARIDRVQHLLASTPNSFWPDQYSNPNNALAHRQTMAEIVRELAGEVDYLFCATSTCGTISGCADYIRDAGLSTKIYAVDAFGSVIFGGPSAKRLIPGHGAAIRPKLYQDNMYDKFIHVSDLDCVVGCRRLIQHESLLMGGSSGAVLMAIDSVKDEIPPHSNCVAIFPDRGERYLDTIYSDVWVEEHFGSMSHLWQQQAERELCELVTS